MLNHREDRKSHLRTFLSFWKERAACGNIGRKIFTNSLLFVRRTGMFRRMTMSEVGGIFLQTWPRQTRKLCILLQRMYRLQSYRLPLLCNIFKEFIIDIEYQRWKKKLYLSWNFTFKFTTRYFQIACDTRLIIIMWDQWSSLEIESRFLTHLRKPIINHEFHTFGRLQERKSFQKDAEGSHSVASDLGGGSGMKRIGGQGDISRPCQHGIAVELLCWWDESLNWTALTNDSNISWQGNRRTSHIE